MPFYFSHIPGLAISAKVSLIDFQLTKKVLQEVEFYIRNYTNEENISKGVNGVIDIWAKY